MRQTYTIDGIQAEMRAAGSHWWDAGTMRHFGCRVAPQVYQGPGGVYFVSSEKNYDGSRGFSVRQYDPTAKDIGTIGEFCSLTRSQAHRAAAKLAATPIGEQFRDAVAALDSAMTGSTRPDYGTVADFLAGKPVRLSDRATFRADPYSDGSGYCLRLASKADDRLAKWSDAYKLQREVCRAATTEPAGRDAIVAAAAHHPATVAGDFARTMAAELGLSSEESDALRKLATRHHRLAVRDCNGETIAAGTVERIESQIRKIVERHGGTAILGGDPRGATVKVAVPSGATDDFGKTGIVVPTHD